MKKEESSQQFTVTSAEKSNNKENYSKEFEHIENTPFTAVKLNEMYHIAVGNQIVSEKKFNTIEDAKKYVNKKPWELLFNGVVTYIEKINELKKLEENEQRNDSSN